MSRKIIALASADWHIHKFTAFDIDGSRLIQAIRSADEIMERAAQLKVPLLFSGDLIHSPKNIETETNIWVQNMFRAASRRGPQIIWISGNHDFCRRNTLESKSPSHLDAIMGNFTQLNHTIYMGWELPNFVIWGIPYMNNDEDFVKVVEKFRPETKKWKNKLKILLIHTDLPGAKTTEGFTLHEVQHIPNDLNRFFKDWDLVLAGHIHKPQRLGHGVYMLGCPIQQNVGDSGGEYGYWEVYNDGHMKFIPMNDYPKFIRLKSKEDAPTDPDDINYYIMPEEVLADEDVEFGAFNMNIASKAKLASQYCKLRGVKSQLKRRALKKILNESD